MMHLLAIFIVLVIVGIFVYKSKKHYQVGNIKIYYTFANLRKIERMLESDPDITRIEENTIMDYIRERDLEGLRQYIVDKSYSKKSFNNLVTKIQRAQGF